MHAMVLCVLCILSCLSARAVWSLCKFLAQTSRRAPRRAPRSNGDMEGARLERARGAIDVRRATGNEKPGRLAKRLDAPLELTDRSEPRRHLRPGSGSFDKAVAHGRSAKARDTKECAPATAPGQSTVSSETVPAQAGPPGRLAKRLDAPLQLTDRSEPRRHLRPGSGSFDKAVAHGRSAKARDTKECAPATAPGQSTVSSETVPAQAGSHRRSLRRSGPADQALAHDRAAGTTLSARSSGMPVPGSTSFPLAPGGPPQPLVSPPPRRGGSLTGSNSSIRMLLAQANDEACPPTPLPKPAHARRPLSGTSYHHVVRKLSPRGKTLVRTL